MSKLPSKILIERAQSGGFVVYENLDGGLARTTLGAFTSPVDLVGWLSRNLMPDAAPTGSPPPPAGGTPPAGRLESAVLAKPMAGPEKRASTADLDQADRFARIRPARPQEGDRP